MKVYLSSTKEGIKNILPDTVINSLQIVVDVDKDKLDELLNLDTLKESLERKEITLTY